MENFSGVTIFILASNEELLLKKTIDEIIDTCDSDDIAEITIALKSEDCPAAHYLRSDIFRQRRYAGIKTYVQKKPGIEQCMSELPELVTSSHFLIMAADNEMSPLSIKTLISHAKENSDTIICAAKWKSGSQINKKKSLHLFGSRMLNRLSSRIIKSDAKDPCSIFRIYPVEVYKKLPTGNAKSFLYEYTLKPVALGMKYQEIPTVFIKRNDKKSNFNYLDYFFHAFIYLMYAVKYRKMAKNR